MLCAQRGLAVRPARGAAAALILALLELATPSRAVPTPTQLNSGVAMPHKTMQIVGGTAADIKEFGHQVSWFFDGFHRCGGSIIAPEWVLTASHCCVGAVVSSLHEIIAGTSIITPKGRQHGQVSQIAEIHTHPRFDIRVYSHDIALLRVRTPFTFDSVVHAIPIIESGIQPVAGETVTVTGWGLLKEYSSFQTPVLQKVKVFISDLQTCRAKYLEASWTLPDTLMCAAAEKKDACQGDSGGPLIFTSPEDGKDRLVGIVSSGIGCASREYAGLYTDLRHHEMRAFVVDVTGIKI